MTSLSAMKSKIFSIAMVVLMAMIFSQKSEASFLRFWRGYQKSELTYAQFAASLNEIFLPATAHLAKTPAHLISYQPLLLPEYLIESEKLPAEMALVEYNSEAEYRSYRETIEGQAYSNLHWDYFEKNQSKSAVPVNFEGVLDIDKAYLIGEKINWNNGPTFFYLLRNDEFTHKVLTKDLILMQKEGFEGVVLVAQDYVMIYAKSFLTPALSRLLQWETTLRPGTSLGYGSGIQYTL